METADIRQKNLQLLVDQRFEGKISKLADAVDRQADYLSRCLSAKEHRKKIGERFARHIEQALRLEEGWLDHPHKDANEPKGLYQVESNVSAGPAVAGQAPELNWVQAGSWTEICQADPDPESNAWHPRIAGGEKTFVLRVAGESMLPDYPPGRLIFVDPERTPRNGDDVIAVLTENDQATFKRYLEEPGSGKMLKALNPDWRDPYIPINGNCEIIGVVVADMRVR